MEELEKIVKYLGKDNIKSIKINWEKVLEDRAFPQITIEFYNQHDTNKN
jgi:hypothetical protein